MIWRSALPELVIPDADFSTFVLARGRQQPEKTALVDVETGVRITYGELISAIDRAAKRLLAHGLRPGEMVAICGFNTPSYAVAAHAVWRAGGVVVTMNPLFTVREMHQELADAGVRYLVAASEVIERASEAARLAGVVEVLPLGEPDSLSTFDALAPSHQDTLPPPAPGQPLREGERIAPLSPSSAAQQTSEAGSPGSPSPAPRERGAWAPEASR
jgi:acyl-CoA synthetase (AMP-forming)/AMP-acid ligase II